MLSGPGSRFLPVAGEKPQSCGCPDNCSDPPGADEGAVTEIKGAPPGHSGAGVGPANGTYLKDSVAPFLVVMFPPLSCAHVATRVCVCVCLCHSSRVRLFVTAWTVAHQAPLSTGFSRQEHWGGWPCLLRGSS